MIATAPLPQPEPPRPRLWRDLRVVQRILDDHLAAAVGRYGAAALEAVDLPSLSPSGELQPPQIRAAGALLWAGEVEAAGLPGFVDALSEGLVEGKVLLPITTAADRLMMYRHQRHHRFSAEERRALYGRLFPAQFESSWRGLLGSLAAMAHASSTDGRRAPEARVFAAARDVAQWLTERSGGIASFAARSIADHVRDALVVLRDPDLALALGGGSVWRSLRIHSPQILGRQLDPEPHLERATASLVITGWLADAAHAIEAGSAREPPPAVLAAAEAWLSAIPADGDGA